MKEYKDVTTEPNGRHSNVSISLSKLVGKEIADVEGYITTEFGDYTFKCSWLRFKDGSELWFEGEHDMAYLTNGGKDDDWLDEEVLENVYKTDPDHEDEEEED